MRRAVVFLSRFLIALWIVLVSAFLFLLVFNAPSVPSTPFASVSIKAGSTANVHLPNRIFTCTETSQQFQCQTEVQDRLLELTFTKGGDYGYFFSNCRARYDGRAVGCHKMGSTYAPILADIYEITDSGLNPQQLRAVQQEYWGINVLAQLGEMRLFWISTGLAFAAGISAAFLAWLHPGRLTQAFASFVCGFGIYRLVWDTLGRVPFDTVTPYGVTPDNWVWLVDAISLAAGTGAGLVTAVLLRRRLTPLTKALVSLSSSMGVFNLAWFSLVWSAGYLSPLFGVDLSGVEVWQRVRLLSLGIASVLAIATTILLWLRTSASIKKFVCISSTVGAFALATNFFLSILLGLGYAD